MENVRISNQSFTSRIKILAPQKFETVLSEIRKKNVGNYHNIDRWMVNRPNELGYKTNFANGYTLGIRSCTGLLVKDEQANNASIMAHLLNCSENIQALPLINKFIQGKNAILVGAKCLHEFSIELFDKIKQLIENKKIPLTIMRDLKPNWEIDMAYKGEEDTLYMCIREIRMIKPDFVNNMEKLKEAFKTLKISNADTISFEA